MTESQLDAKLKELLSLPEEMEELRIKITNLAWNML
jgi:hypothetical protein